MKLKAAGLAAIFLASTAWVCEGPTQPTKTKDQNGSTVSIDRNVPSQEGTDLTGGKSCRLTPADPTNIPIGYYVCENGVSFYEPCPVTGCPRVLPMPKKH
jgi:hypothetical protein